MPGPWISWAADPDFAAGHSLSPGAVIEIRAYDDEGADQGYVLVALPAGAKPGEKVPGRYLAASDDYYAWWANQRDPISNYHFCKGPRGRCRATGEDLIHVDTYRTIEGTDGQPGGVRWIKGPARQALLRYLEAAGGGAGAAPPPLPVVPGAAAGARPPAGERLLVGAAGDDLTKDLRELRGRLEGGRGPRTPPGPPRRRTPSPRRRPPRRSRSPPPGGRGEDGLDRRRHAGRGRDRDPFGPAEAGRGRKDEGGRRDGGRGSPSDRARQERSRERRSGERRPGAERDRPATEGSERHPSERRVTRSRGAGRDRGRTPERGRPRDRRRRTRSRSRRARSSGRAGGRRSFGPFGAGTADPDSDGASSRSSSAGDERGRDRLSHAQLLRYAVRHPGRLAERLLRRMWSMTEHGGGAGGESGQGPAPGAMKYWYAILQPQNPMMGPRNARETKTLCRALDLLSERRYGEAADVLAQRLKGVERSFKDGNWDRAMWCELLPPDGVTLLDRDEDRMLAKEQRLEAKLQPRREYRYEPGPKGKGSEPSKGKGKGQRGKGKEGTKEKEGA